MWGKNQSLSLNFWKCCTPKALLGLKTGVILLPGTWVFPNFWEPWLYDGIGSFIFWGLWLWILITTLITVGALFLFLKTRVGQVFPYEEHLLLVLKNKLEWFIYLFIYIFCLDSWRTRPINEIGKFSFENQTQFWITGIGNWCLIVC
jgi:hypothetical protein